MSNQGIRDGIGGYMSLECGQGTPLAWMEGALSFQSARDAMAAYFEAIAPRRIWMPHFICESAVEAVLGIAPMERYPLNESFAPESDLDVTPDDVIVIVDYFGLCGSAVTQAAAAYSHAHVLIDASQSLFFPPIPGISLVTSPRKFVGVPDGGFLLTETTVTPPLKADELASIMRCQPLLLRAAGLREEGYARFRETERTLEITQPHAMSQLTHGLLAGIDFNAVAHQRRSNFDFLAEQLGHLVPAGLMPNRSSVPLCFPVHARNPAGTRESLRSQGVFSPHYWPGVAIPPRDASGEMLAHGIVCLPCDQRYDKEDMISICRAFLAEPSSHDFSNAHREGNPR
ncbi:hypothetical protein EC912_103447 [Luteibacter rhizovicinus]|uniref:dTDP-4-amino-4,6-dideoxygalactose transaminase n=1 Tax=Luteibacter rhizovicinus TaxID=242606 RepID=A0A4R3YUC3_9GAMM|nr:hypothetical protein EC912_103447 [Luteibacter rhizovicinus]